LRQANGWLEYIHWRFVTWYRADNAILIVTAAEPIVAADRFAREIVAFLTSLLRRARGG